MKPEEVALAMIHFTQEVSLLNGDDLLDKWIAFKESSDSKEPDLGVLKGNHLEMMLCNQFGLGGWQEKVAGRKKAKPDT